jgi:hypothetical protein
MPHHGNPQRAVARSFLTLLCLFGCASPPSTRPAPEQELSGVPVGLDFGGTNTIYPGTLDSESHFVSNVMLVAASSSQQLTWKPRPGLPRMRRGHRTETAGGCL